jgi:hypothetical protein
LEVSRGYVYGVWRRLGLSFTQAGRYLGLE